jgi:hypothetical protein
MIQSMRQSGSILLLLNGIVRGRDSDGSLLFNIRDAVDLTQAVNVILLDLSGENPEILELLLNLHTSLLSGGCYRSNLVYMGFADTQRETNFGHCAFTPLFSANM